MFINRNQNIPWMKLDRWAYRSFRTLELYIVWTSARRLRRNVSNSFRQAVRLHIHIQPNNTIIRLDSPVLYDARAQGTSGEFLADPCNVNCAVIFAVCSKIRPWVGDGSIDHQIVRALASEQANDSTFVAYVPHVETSPKVVVEVIIPDKDVCTWWHAYIT